MSLRRPDARLRLEAARALSKITGKKEPSAGALALLLRDSDPKIRRDACRALSELGPPIPEARLPLERAATDPALDVRDAARAALKDLGEK